MDQETKNRKARIGRALRGAIDNSVPVYRALNELLDSNPRIKKVALIVEIDLVMEEELVLEDPLPDKK